MLIEIKCFERTQCCLRCSSRGFRSLQLFRNSVSYGVLLLFEALAQGELGGEGMATPSSCSGSEEGEGASDSGLCLSRAARKNEAWAATGITTRSENPGGGHTNLCVDPEKYLLILIVGNDTR